MTNETESGPTSSDDTIKGFSLSGDEVAQLNDKSFTICSKPRYEQYIQEDKEPKDYLIIPIQLANGTKADWAANKTSQKVIITARGRSLNDWIGYKGEFVVKEQRIGKEDKKVIYLKE